MGAHQQPHVLEAQAAWSSASSSCAERAGLVHAGVHQHHAAARGDRVGVHVRHARPGQRQAQAPQPGQHAVGAGQLVASARSRVDQHAGVEDARGVELRAWPRAAPRRTAPGAGGRTTGRWSRPTAWWWVIVPPAAMIASDAAVLDLCHCSSSRPRRAGREHGEVGRGAVGVDVGEAAGDAALAALGAACRGLAHRRPRTRRSVPGDRRLEGLGQHAGRHHRVAQVGRLEEGVAPGALGARRARRRGRSGAARRRLAAVVGAQLQRRAPSRRRADGRPTRSRAPARAAARSHAPGQRRLARVEQAAVGRVQARTARARAPPAAPASKLVEPHAGRGPEARPRPAPAPTPR